MRKSDIGLILLAFLSVGVAVFFIAWNSRQYLANGYVLFLGISLLFIAMLANSASVWNRR